MTSHVQKLAEAPCPAKTKDNPYHDEACCMCHGTGPLVPGLRQECHHISQGITEADIADGSWQYDDPDYEEACYGEDGCSSCNCQGSGWILRPEAEHMGVLVRFMRDSTSVWLTAKEIVEALFSDMPEEALAHAIYQVYGIK